MKHSLLSEVMDSVDFKDEYVLKLIKDVHFGNLSDDEFLLAVTAHERRFKLTALGGDENENET